MAGVKFLTVAEAIEATDGRFEAVVEAALQDAVSTMTDEVFAMTFHPPLDLDDGLLAKAA